MKKAEKQQMDHVSGGVLYGLVLGTLIYALSGDPVFFSLVGPRAMLGLLLEVSAGQVKSKYPVGVIAGLLFGLLPELVLFAVTSKALWFALALPGGVLGLLLQRAAASRDRGRLPTAE